MQSIKLYGVRATEPATMNPSWELASWPTRDTAQGTIVAISDYDKSNKQVNMLEIQTRNNLKVASIGSFVVAGSELLLGVYQGQHNDELYAAISYVISSVAMTASVFFARVSQPELHANSQTR